MATYWSSLGNSRERKPNVIRRILLVLSLVALMAAMVVVSAMPAFAAPVKNPNSTTQTFTCDGQEEELLLVNPFSAAPAFTEEGRPLPGKGAVGTVTFPDGEELEINFPFKGKGLQGDLESCSGNYTLDDGTEFDVTVEAFRPPRGRG
jgi:hypothetical protein